jgi:multidrug efflux system outer membrane protein
VAKAVFFPRFSLTGAGGIVSPDLHAASKGIKGVWSVGANVDWLAPIFGGAQLTAALEFRKAAWEEAKAVYEQTALGAFREVSDALADIEHYRVQLADRARQVESLERAAQLSYERFAGGVGTYLEVVTAQERLLPAQLQLAVVRGAQLRALVRLYRALGGGWQVTQAGAAAASASLAPVVSPPLPPALSASTLAPTPSALPSAAPSTVP